MEFDKIIQSICDRALRILKVDYLHFKPMNRKNCVANQRSFIIGRTNLNTGLITIDIFTPKKRRPRTVASVLRILCHEVAHHQKPPYRQRYRGRIITRRHYPVYYRQVNRNINKLKKDNELKKYFKKILISKS